MQVLWNIVKGEIAFQHEFAQHLVVSCILKDNWMILLLLFHYLWSAFKLSVDYVLAIFTTCCFRKAVVGFSETGDNIGKLQGQMGFSVASCGYDFHE